MTLYMKFVSLRPKFIISFMIGVDLFSGAGGLSLGAETAGVNIKYAVEYDKYAAETYAHNHKNIPIFVEDIRLLSELPSHLYNNHKAKVLMGGPPCQGFSLSNLKTRNKENENNWLFKEFIRITKLWMPDWIVLENVSGILKTEEGFFWEQIINEFEKIGYTISFKLLYATDYGVPQKRHRVFLIGSLHGIQYEFPPIEQNQIAVTVADAISDLPSLPNGANFEKLEYKNNPTSSYARLLRGASKFSTNNFVTKNSELTIKRYSFIPQGGNWENIPKELMANYKDCSRCHTGIYHRLEANKPSTVIGNYRKNMLIHPWEDRGLSVREAARIQSFPDSFEFKGSIGFQQQQVGNAVPPLLAKIVFDKLLSY